MKKIEYEAIACIGKNREIGKNGKLLFHIKEDMDTFTQLTKLDVVVMGRKTWESLNKKPLPYRTNIVLTHDKEFHPDGAFVFNSVEDMEKFIAEYFADSIVWIIGGESVYKEFLPKCANLMLTEVDAEDGEADACFPDFRDDYMEAWRSDEMTDKKTKLKFVYKFYRRKNGK